MIIRRMMNHGTLMERSVHQSPRTFRNVRRPQANDTERSWNVRRMMNVQYRSVSFTQISYEQPG